MRRSITPCSARPISVPVEARQAFGLDFVLQLPLHFLLGLRTEVAGQHLARPMPDAVGKIVTGDVEDFSVLGDAAHDDMDVRMTSVVMISGHPIERRAEIGFHLRHDIPCERLQVLIGRAVLRREDDPELMAILQPAFDERVAVRLVGEGRIEPARLALAVDALALQVTQMGLYRAGLSLGLHDPDLHRHPTGPYSRSELSIK